MTSISDVEKEVKDDIAKSDMQLLVNIHEELLRDDRSIPENLIHAQKWLASLFVKLSRQAEESTKETTKLNKRILYLTWVIAILTAIFLLVNFFQFPKITILGHQTKTQGEQKIK
jgi:hypothetical protein